MRERGRWWRRDNRAQDLTACASVKQQKVSGRAFHGQKPQSMPAITAPMLWLAAFDPRKLVQG